MVRHGERVHPTWVMMLVKVNHLLLTINSATNILLYSYKVRYFGNKTEVFLHILKTLHNCARLRRS